MAESLRVVIAGGGTGGHLYPGLAIARALVGEEPRVAPFFVGAGRGIEVTVQKDDGQRVTIAQRDDGDVQMGDRVAIVYDRNGVAKAVRDAGYRQD